MSPPRVVIVVETEGAVTADVLGVESVADARRLQGELAQRAVLAEIKDALAELWDELAERARELS